MARPKKSKVKMKKMKSKKVVKKTKKRSARKTKGKTKAKAKAKVKKSKVEAIQKGYNSVTPYLIFNDAGKAIQFYQTVFAAKERVRMKHGNRITHAELKIGDSVIMLSDECPEQGAMSPKGNVGGGIHLYVKNVDEVFKKATSAGAKVIREVEDMFYGDRNACIEDPFGFQWTISTHVEDVTPAKMRKRTQELFGKALVSE